MEILGGVNLRTLGSKEKGSGEIEGNGGPPDGLPGNLSATSVINRLFSAAGALFAPKIMAQIGKQSKRAN